eukprot:TRINITY_DN1762_c0_g1_i3.p2 TRINITY_DN1762_c0_g1~~TRINITY_DN1762_c0_g1_i3.p2  ORF type:complete len:205 (+),score=82.24 TRINITY_DN1762_c0_g1_i3:295-909(+)
MSHLSADKQKQCSKSMSYILRHGAVKDGYNITDKGFVAVDQIRSKGPRCLSSLSDADVQFLVDNNDKQRFRAEKDDKGRMWVAANQGHSGSLGLQAENFMQEITDAAQVPIAVHGTYRDPLEAIKRDGLSRMGRQHIHFAVGLPGGDGVISGMRKTAQVLIYLDTAKCIAGGIKLYRSNNDVILSPGDAGGFIKPEFFAKIVEN